MQIDEIKNLLTNYKITIEQHHIDFFDKEFERFADSRVNADSLALEYDLLYKGYGQQPAHNAHDIIMGNHKIDFKEIFGRWHNLYKRYDGKRNMWNSKMTWHIDCAIKGDVTHFAPYRIINRNRMDEYKNGYTYKVGDELVVKVIEITEAREYLKRAMPSKRSNPRDDKYIMIGD